MKNFRNTVPFLVLGFCLLSVSVMADRIENVSESFDADGAKEIEVEGDFGLGRLIINPADMDEVAKFEIEYDSRRIRHYLDYSTRGNTGYLEFGTKNRRSFHGDDIINDWEILLSTKYPTDLSLDIGACEATIDLGGIPLTEVALDIGAVDGEITFSKKNPIRMENFDLDIGASSIELSQLGNANFEYMAFDCGAASCKLDFSGDWEGSAEIQIDVGVGSAKIIIPKDLDVRIMTDSDGWFSSIDFHNDELEELRDGVYETEGYRKAEIRLLIEVDVGMGSVDFYFR